MSKRPRNQLEEADTEVWIVWTAIPLLITDLNTNI